MFAACVCQAKSVLYLGTTGVIVGSPQLLQLEQKVMAFTSKLPFSSLQGTDYALSWHQTSVRKLKQQGNHSESKYSTSEKETGNLPHVLVSMRIMRDKHMGNSVKP